jgi:hypothetical protein
MNINNVTEFCNMMRSVGLSSIIGNLNGCIAHYSAICDCDNPSEKAKKYQECNDMYAAIVRSSIPSNAFSIKKKLKVQSIAFYKNGSLIASY